MSDSSKNINNLEEKLKSTDHRWAYGTFFLLIAIVVLTVSFYLLRFKSAQSSIINPQSSIVNQPPSFIMTPTSPALPPKPPTKTLTNDGYHIFQSFNNCGPAALSMALRFYGINVSQEILGQALRPYQIPSGDNDDKSVTLEEVAEKSKDYGYIPYLRPMGNEQVLKQFITNNMPIIVRTWTKPNEDIGHYRIIKGYDDNQGIFVQDDSLQGHDLEYSYADFNEIWKKFNYEYLVLVPKDKQEIAERIIGEDKDAKVAWQKAKQNSLKELAKNPDDTDARFNLSIAYYKLGDYQKSVEEFEKIENELSFRTLWYQLEPVIAYYKLGNYDRVMQITDKVINNQNRAYSELYILRGKIYKEQGNNNLAKQEFEKAVLYNSNLKEARDLLNSI